MSDDSERALIMRTCRSDVADDEEEGDGDSDGDGRNL